MVKNCRFSYVLFRFKHITGLPITNRRISWLSIYRFSLCFTGNTPNGFLSTSVEDFVYINLNHTSITLPKKLHWWRWNHPHVFVASTINIIAVTCYLILHWNNNLQTLSEWPSFKQFTNLIFIENDPVDFESIENIERRYIRFYVYW